MKNEMVFITQGHPSRYHRPIDNLNATDCGMYDGRQDTRPTIQLELISRSKAERNGLSPCRVCYRKELS